VDCTVADYISVLLRKKLERSSHPHKEEFISWLWGMCEDDDESNTATFYHAQNLG